MSITPLRDLLYVLPMRDPSEVGLIIRPDTHQQRTDQGIVKYRGPDTTGEIKVGDHILFSPHAGDEIVVEGEGPLILIREGFVDCIFNDDEPSYLLNLEQVRLAVKRAGAEVSRTDEHREDGIIVDKIVRRMLEHLDSRFIEELYF